MQLPYLCVYMRERQPMALSIVEFDRTLTNTLGNRIVIGLR